MCPSHVSTFEPLESHIDNALQNHKRSTWLLSATPSAQSPKPNKNTKIYSQVWKEGCLDSSALFSFCFKDLINRQETFLSSFPFYTTSEVSGKRSLQLIGLEQEAVMEKGPQKWTELLFPCWTGCTTRMASGHRPSKSAVWGRGRWNELFYTLVVKHCRRTWGHL